MIRLLLTIVFIILISGVVIAQIPPPPPPPDPVPIDGGALALLAAGAVYGYKKIKERRKVNENI